MPVQIMTPQEIIAAIQSGVPLYAPRSGGKRLTISIVNQMAHLIKLEEEYNKLKEANAVEFTEDNKNGRKLK